tara:strand:+ start:2335 stop:2739 length:405 start_codon:yes stop_codon:yes gene_type:complete
MATLTPTLTLASTDVTSDTLSFSVTDSLTVAAPLVGISKIVATATGSQSVIVPASTVIAYLYVKHTGTTDGSTSTTRQVDVEFTTDEAIARLSAGEFLFMPVHHAEANVGVQLHVQHSSSSDVVQMEYAFFTKG